MALKNMTKMSPLPAIIALLLTLFTAAASLSNEGKSLMSIKASFSNVANVLLDWNPSLPTNVDDHCSWRGVVCDIMTSTVVSLNLTNLNLGGEIAPAIGQLKNLQFIDLKGNRLTGQIPDEIGDCASLEYIDLSSNSLYGDIPFSIFKLKLLKALYLKNN